MLSRLFSNPGRAGVILAFAALIALALALRLATFERYLPFADYVDEVNMYLLGRDWLGIEHDPVVPNWLAGYPPLYVWMSMGVQVGVNNLVPRPWLFVGDYLYYARLVAALAGVLTTVVVASIGWQLAGALAGWLAGMVWGLAPIIVDHNSLAIPDPMVYLGCALALSLALRAWRTASPRWATLSLLAGIATIYLKYSAVYALIPGGFVILLLAYRHPRRWWPWLLVQGGLLTVAAAWLVWGYGALQLSNREADTVRAEGLRLLLAVDRNLNNWWFGIYPIGQALFWPVIAGALAVLAYKRLRDRARFSIAQVAMLLIYAVAAVLVSVMFSRVNFPAGKIRHTLPVTVALIPLWAAGFAVLWRWLGERVQRMAALWHWTPAFLALALAITFILPAMSENIRLIRQYQRTDIRQALWQWSDANLPPGGRILMHPNSRIERTWNRTWSGYDGVTPFEWWFEDDLPENTPTEYVERGITYFAMSEADWGGVFARRKAQVRSFIDQLVLVKEIKPSDGVTGDPVWVYRMMPPQVELDHVVFGDQIALVGYDLDTASGNTIRFRPYWRIRNRPATNYSMFVHFYPADALEVITQYDGAPTTPQRLTLTWDDLDELYIGADVTLTLPDDLPPGDYRLAVGLYDFSGGQRLRLGTGDDFYSISVTVP